jgi:hypothetical protein
MNKTMKAVFEKVKRKRKAKEQLMKRLKGV